jgi:hypothetical protein
MRKCVILTSIILFLPSMLAAQSGGARAAGTENGTRATIFGGYSYLRNNSNGFKVPFLQHTSILPPHADGMERAIQQVVRTTKLATLRRQSED